MSTYTVQNVILVRCEHGNYALYNNHGSKIGINWIAKCGCGYKSADKIGEKWAEKLRKIGPKTVENGSPTRA